MRTLHVVTHRKWVADDLTKGAGDGVTVQHSLGLDLPDIQPGDALWAPMEWTARALHDRRLDGTRPALHLVDPGASFLTRVPFVLRNRNVGVQRLADLAGGVAPAEGFFKPANCKIEGLPAGWYRRDEFLQQAREAGVPDTSRILLTPIRLGLVEEYRVFILHGQPVTASPYLIHDPDGTEATWFDGMPGPRAGEAMRFAAEVADALRGTGWLPPVFVLDVAVTHSPRGPYGDPGWVVVEANPVWSSAQYGCDPVAVVACLLAAASPEPTRWDWVPDAYLLHRITQQRPLPVA